MTICRKITAPFIAFLLLILAVTAPVLYTLSSKMEETATTTQSVGGAIEVSRGLDIILTQARRQTELLANMPSVATVLLHSPTTSPDIPAKECDRVRELLQFTTAASEAVDVMNIVNTQGEVVCSSYPLTEGTQRQDRRYFQSAMQGESVMEGPLTSRATGHPVVTLATPIKISGEVTGVLSCSIALEKLNTALTKKTSIQRTGSVYVLSSRGQIIIHPQSNVLLSNDRFPPERISQMQANGQGSFTEERADGQTVRVAYVALPNPDWLVLYEDTLEHLPRIPLTRNIGLLGVMLPLLAALLFLTPSMLRVCKDIRNLTIFARQSLSSKSSETGRPDMAELPPLLQHAAKRRDELGDLACAMYSLTQDTDKANEKAKQAKQDAKRARKELFQLTTCLDGVGGGVAAMRLDAASTIIWASQGYFRFFGLAWDNPEMAGDTAQVIALTQNPMRSVHPDDIAMLGDILTTATRQQNLVSATFRIIRSDGSLLPLNMRGTVVGHDDVYPVFLAAFMPVNATPETNDSPSGEPS